MTARRKVDPNLLRCDSPQCKSCSRGRSGTLPGILRPALNSLAASNHRPIARRLDSVLLPDERCNGLPHIAEMAQPVLLLDLAHVGGQTMIVEDARYPSGKVSAAGMLVERFGRMILQQRRELS
jgi:hypothetical protein